MNRIVREHYPVANLPEDLRAGFDATADVVVTVEEVAKPARSVTLEEIWAQRKPPFRSGEEIVATIRAQRDAWDE